MKRKRRTESTRLILGAVLRGEMTSTQFRAASSARYFKKIVAELRRVDDARVQDFLTKAPVRPEDATLAVQLFGDERRRYEEIKKRRSERGKGVFTTETNDAEISTRKTTRQNNPFRRVF